MWNRYGVSVSKKGRICYKDFCEKVIKISHDDEKCMNLIDAKQKYYIDDHLYITCDAIITILINIYSKAVVNFCVTNLESLINECDYDITLSKEKKIKKSDADITYFDINGQNFYKAKDICIFLNYSDTKSSVSRHVTTNNKIKFDEMMIKFRGDGIILLGKKFFDPQTVFINQNGLNELLIKSAKPNSISLAKQMGINTIQKFTRKEIDIVCELDLFCKSAGIKSKHSYLYIDSKHTYMIDYYLSDYNLAIEIDEYDHKDRDPEYEKHREKYLSKNMKCKFIRCNPDASDFSISGLIGQIYKAIT